MRTKTLILAAVAALGVGIYTSQAAVTSANIVGYVNKPVATGFNALANPFVTVVAGNTNLASDILPTIPDLSFLLKWNGTGYDVYGVFGGQYYDQDYNGVVPTPTLNPGEAFFVQTPSDFTNTFVGSVAVAPGTTNVLNLPAGFDFVSDVAPFAGGASSVLGLNPPDLTFLLQWNGTQFVTYGYFGGSWYDQDYNGVVPEPQIKVGEGFFLQLPTSYSWTNSIPNN